MKRIISLLLILSVFSSFIACGNNDNDVTNDPQENTPPSVNNTPTTPTIIVPEYKDYGRGSVDFKDITYSRPDLEAIISAFTTAKSLVSANETDITEQIAAIKELESGYTYTESMYALAEIYSHRDTSVEFWQNEFKYISTNYPAFIKAVEDLLVACALSENKDAFEKDYFGYSLDEYKDGGIYTDELVTLLEAEAQKEAEYSSISTANVEIVYNSVAGFTWEGTVDEVIKKAEEEYGKDSTEYKNVLVIITNLYKQRVNELSIPIYVDLFRTRKLIAEELGYDSYTQFAYKNMGYDYSPEQMRDLLESVGRYVAPVTENLNAVTFTSYFKRINQPRVDNVTVANTLYTAYSRTGGAVFDSYSYMLQHGLYDISPTVKNRYEGAFTAYIESNNSPFVFVSSSGFIKDYLTLAHEFGHFYDGYVNYGEDTSLALAEVSSQGLELLSVLRLKSELKTTDYEYLEYLAMYNMLNNVLMLQSFYATFEHLAYELDYDEINAKNLNNVTKEAFTAVYGHELEDVANPVNYVIIPHTILYPMYVESYVASAIPSLEIFFKESYRTGNAGDGFAMYTGLVNREDSSDLSFIESLTSVGLSSPFEAVTVKNISNLIHYQISGQYYYKDSSSDVGDA